MQKWMKRIGEYAIDFCIFIFISRLALYLFQKISESSNMTITETHILLPIFVLFYLCVALPMILISIQKLKEKRNY